MYVCVTFQKKQLKFAPKTNFQRHASQVLTVVARNPLQNNLKLVNSIVQQSF